MEKVLHTRKFIEQAADRLNGDYSHAFKLLGFIVFLAQEGNESLLSGSMISPRTYYRWMEQVNQAGFGDLVADAALRQALQEFIWQRHAGLPIEKARNQVLEAVNLIVSEQAPPLIAKSCRASEAVKGAQASAG